MTERELRLKLTDRELRIRKNFPNVKKFDLKEILTTHRRFKSYRRTYSEPKYSMSYRERVTPLDIVYVVTEHADDRLETRSISEYDVKQTITRGNVIESEGRYVYVYKYFRVVVDREVTDLTEKVEVCTAMYVYEFFDVLNTCKELFVANRKVMVNALRCVYDEIGEAMYKNPKRVFGLLESYGFVRRDSFFGESILYSYSNEDLPLGNETIESIKAIRKVLSDEHDNIMRRDTCNILSRSLGIDSQSIKSFKENGRKFVFNSVALSGLSGEAVQIIRDMVKYPDDVIIISKEGFKVYRGSRYDVVVIEFGKVSWIVNFVYHNHFERFWDGYAGMSLGRGVAKSILNAYVNALGLYVYSKEDSELKRNFIVRSINESNRKKMEWTLAYQEKYLEETGLTIG